MKKSILLLASAALLFAGCAKVVNEEPDVVPEPEQTTQKVTLKASIGESTRVSADADGYYAWQPGDIIAVHVKGPDEDRIVPFTATTTSSATTTDFEGEMQTNERLGDYAFYPVGGTDAGHDVDSDGDVLFGLWPDYQYVKDATNMPMLGTITSSGANFKSVGGIIKLIVYNVPTGTDVLAFTVNDEDAKITGAFSITKDNEDNDVITLDSHEVGGGNVLYFYLWEKDENQNYVRSLWEQNMVFYIPLPCGTYHSFTFSFNDIFDENGIAHTPTSVTKKAGMGGDGLQVHRNEIIVPPALNFGGSEAKNLFMETFGDYTGSVVSYDFRGTTTYDETTSSLNYTVSANTVKIESTTASPLTSNNLFFPKAQTDFIISGIKLEGSTNITVSYDVSKGNMDVYYRVDSGDYIQAKSGSSSGANSFTKTVSGNSLTLKFSNPSAKENNRLDNIKVVSAGSTTTIPTISTGSDAVTIGAGSLSNSVTNVKLSNPMDSQGIAFVIDSGSPWISSVEIFDGDITTGDAKVRITASGYNHGEQARVGYVYFKATGAATKTITVTQNPSIVASPTLTTTPGDNTFTVTWNGDNKAQSYIGSYSTTELQDPSTGTALTITNSGSSYSATPSVSVSNGTVYHIYVKVNEVASSYAEKYAASTVWSHATVTPTAPTTIADVLTGGVDCGPYSVYGLTCFAKIDNNNAIVGDNTGRMLLYKSGNSGHGLSAGDVFNIVNGNTSLYNSAIYEWNSPSVTKTGTTLVDHGTATVLNNTSCAQLVTAFDGQRHSAVYVSGTGTKNGRNITVGSYTLYLGVERSDISDGEYNFNGYVYAYMNSKLSFMLTSYSAAGSTTHTACEWSISGSTDTYTSGYTFNSTFSRKTGYYQDGSTGECYIKLYHTTTPMFATTPSSITFKAKIGGGSGDKDLTNPVYVCLVDSQGNDINGTATPVTSHITTNTGDDYIISIAPVAPAYGVRLYHTKESGYNVRYYSFSLEYTTTD